MLIGTVVEGWMLRGSYNRAVRAPNVNELFRSQAIALWSGDDLCANQPDTGVPGNTEAQCLNTGMSSSQYGNVTSSPAGQYNQFAGGNP